MSLDPIIQTYGNPLLCFSIASVKHILVEQYQQFYGQYNGFELLNISQDHTTSPEIESLADTHQSSDITYMQLQSYIKEKENCLKNNLQGQSLQRNCSSSCSLTTTGSTLTSTTSTKITSTTFYVDKHYVDHYKVGNFKVNSHITVWRSKAKIIKLAFVHSRNFTEKVDRNF